MEIYVAYKDYNWMMDFTERMLEKICLDVNGSTTEVKVGDNTISFKAPPACNQNCRPSREHTGVDIERHGRRAGCVVAARQPGVEVDGNHGLSKIIDEIFGEKCEGIYIQPTFITDYPIDAPLTKRHRSNPELTERFELMVNGKELANAYSGA